MSARYCGSIFQAHQATREISLLHLFVTLPVYCALGNTSVTHTTFLRSGLFILLNYIFNVRGLSQRFKIEHWELKVPAICTSERNTN